MINQDDIRRTTKNTNKKGYSLCYCCGKKINNNGYLMRICLCKDGMLVYNNELYQYVDFHIDCWMEIGGEEYVFALPERLKQTGEP